MENGEWRIKNEALRDREFPAMLSLNFLISKRFEKTLNFNKKNAQRTYISVKTPVRYF